MLNKLAGAFQVFSSQPAMDKFRHSAIKGIQVFVFHHQLVLSKKTSQRVHVFQVHGPGVNNIGDNKNIKDQEGTTKLKEENAVLLKKIAGNDSLALLDKQSRKIIEGFVQETVINLIQLNVLNCKSFNNVCIKISQMNYQGIFLKNNYFCFYGPTNTR